MRSKPGDAARFLFATSPLLALLALALFPAIAQAEVSGEQVYHVAPPKIESVVTEKTGKPETPAKTHSAPHPHLKSKATEPAAEPEPESDDRQSRAVAPSEGGGHSSGGGHGGRGSGERAPPKVGSTPTETDPSRAQGGGGSSPVVPILIAMVVLAAVSIGLVLHPTLRKTGAPSIGPPRQ